MLRRLAGGLLLPLVPQYLTAAAQQAGRRLVLVELSGANDGLNTVIPFQDHRYRELRPHIGIERQDMITLDSGFALHGAMRRVMESWDDGDLAILPGLGYPNPNRSHFKSIALWETGGDGNGSGRSGWLTQAVEGMPGTADLDAHGISLDGGMGVFASPSGIWL
ncbi:MAG: twin-arginine translocation pathway signal protein, partial [SAR324 cluster bacterium]|nr:twin-arginine translocation pathway signal protein [SAR324 cluster bacterium]